MTVLNLETLESIIKVNFEFAQKLFKDEGGIYPMAVGYTRDNTQRVCIVGKFSDQKEKQEWAVLVTMLFAYYDVDKYAFMSEGWCVVPEAKGDEEAVKEAHQYGSLENHPNRLEILSLLAITRYGRQAAVKQITEDKQLIDFPKGNVRGGDLKGLMCDLLPPKDIPPEIKQKMKGMVDMLKEKGLVKVEVIGEGT
jgi:hypothetical protein